MSKLEVFDSLKDKACQGGGNEKIHMQHNLNKLTARERVSLLLDEGSFIELGAFISGNGGAVITGHGTINGRLVYVYSEDYTVDGSMFTKVKANKIVKLLENAAKMGAPVIQIMDSIGGSLVEGTELLSSYGMVLNRLGKLSGVVPTITIACGPCNGMNSIMATMSDFVIAVEIISELSVMPSSKLTIAEGGYINNDMIGDSLTSNKTGNAHIDAKSEEEAILTARKIVNYLPSNCLEEAWVCNEDKDLNIPKETLDNMVESDNYSMDEIINNIADENSVIELYKQFGVNFKVCLVKINGLTAGLICNVGNKEIDNKGSIKVSSFVRLCDSFNIPIVTLVDTKGITKSLKEETEGLAKNFGKLAYTIIDANIPKVALIIGEASGAGFVTLASKEASFDQTLAWPSAKISLTNPEDYIKSVYRDEIFASEDFKENEAVVVKKYYDDVVNPYKAAESGLIDNIIKPSQTKQRVFAILDMLQTKKELKYTKRHGSTLV